MPTIKQKNISIQQAAIIQGFSQKTVRNHYNKGLIKGAFRIDGGHIRIPIDSEYFGRKPEPVKKPTRILKTNYERALWLAGEIK